MARYKITLLVWLTFFFIMASPAYSFSKGKPYQPSAPYLDEPYAKCLFPLWLYEILIKEAVKAKEVKRRVKVRVYYGRSKFGFSFLIDY